MNKLKNVNKRRLTIALALVLALTSVEVYSQTRFESLNYLYEIQERDQPFIVSGQHNDQKDLDCPQVGSGPTDASYWTDKVYDITGKYPALYGADFLFHGDDQKRWNITYEAERQWNAGAMISLMWHCCPPTYGSTCNWDPGVTNVDLSNSEWDELLTDGTNLNNTWKSRIDNEVAPYLQYLEDTGVEVFWRPLHEQNQHIFWWNHPTDRSRTIDLWRLTHDYMTNELGLSNLIWVWDVQDISSTSNYEEYNPGSEYWDIIALDIYSDGYTNSTYYDKINTIADNKPIAIGENFELPSDQAINDYPDYTFFMTWAYGLKVSGAWSGCEITNTDAYIRQVYNNSSVVTRDEMPGWNNDGGAANLAYNQPVYASSNENSELVAANAVDGDGSTRWSSAYSDGESITVDLGATYNVNQVVLNWESAYASAYQIQFSTDDVNYTTVYETYSGDGGIDDMSISGTARYVRMYGITRATEWGFSLWEFEVYGDPVDTGSGNLALQQPIYASSNENSELVAANAVDGDDGTRWSSAYSDGESITVDLGANYNVNQVVLDWETAYASAYQIQFSTDDANYTTVYEDYSGDGGIDDISVSGTARYVRMYGITRATEWGFSLWEFEVYGSSGSRIGNDQERNQVSELMKKHPYPNPFRGEVAIPVHATEAYDLKIYDVSGSLIRNYVKENLAKKGKYLIWDGTNRNNNEVADGMYYYRLKSDSGLTTGKLVKGN